MRVIIKIFTTICLLIILATLYHIAPSHTNAQTTALTPIRMWACADEALELGYAYAYGVCAQVPYPCPLPSGNCYRTLTECIANCVPVTPNPIVSRPVTDYICTPIWAPGVLGINSAIGCIPASQTIQLLIFVLRWSLGVGSGAAFLTIVYSGFVFATSGGDVNKVKEAKKLLTAAVSGLMLIIFSAFVLDLFGVQIFRIPGL